MCVPESDSQLTESPPRGCLALLPRMLRKWRLNHALKAADAAGRLGVAPATWGHWETGNRFPSAENLLLLSRLTGSPLQHFFCPHADTCPKSVPGAEPAPAATPTCATCGAPLYQE